MKNVEKSDILRATNFYFEFDAWQVNWVQFYQHSMASFYASSLTQILLAHSIERKSI
jgi:hypothetical protein